MLENRASVSALAAVLFYQHPAPYTIDDHGSGLPRERSLKATCLVVGQ